MAEVPDDLADLLGDTAKALKEGETQVMPIRRAESYNLLLGDQVAMTLGGTGTIDLSVISLQSRAAHQLLVVESKSDQGMTFTPGGVQLVPELVEEGAVRLSQATALDVAALIMRILKDAGEEDLVRSRLSADGWL